MKDIFKDILISILIIAILILGLEFAQRVRYCLKYNSPDYLTYGMKGGDASGELLDTFSEVRVVALDGYIKCVPGVYIRKSGKKEIPIHINRLGFRGDEIEVKKNDGMLRIAVLGASVVLAPESTENATFPRILQNLINKNKDFLAKIGKNKAEVINTGVIGQTTLAVLNLLRKEILQLQPDIAIVYTAANSYHHGRIFGPIVFAENSFLRIPLAKTMVWFRRHSLLFETLYEKLTIFSKAKLSPECAKTIFNSYSSHIRSIIQTARANNISLILVKQPIFIAGFPPLQDELLMSEIENHIKNGFRITYEQASYWMQSRLLDILDELSEQYDIKIIDPFPEIESQNKETLFRDIVHLTDKGNAFLAELIFKELGKEYAAEKTSIK